MTDNLFVLPNPFQYTGNNCIPSFVQKSNIPEKRKEKILKILDTINKQKSSHIWLQAALHVHFLRNFDPPPLYPQGLVKTIKFLTQKYHLNIDLGSENPKLPGLAPQFELSMLAYLKGLDYYENIGKNMARLILISTNPGAGKTNFDFVMFFLYQNGFPYWPMNNLKPSDYGLPPVLIISSGRVILRSDYMPLLQRRYPFLPPECFQVLDPTEVKPEERNRWLRNIITKNREKGLDGVYFLGMTPQCLALELNRFLKKQKGSIFPCLANVHLLILDEIDALGTQSLRKKIGKKIGNKYSIGLQCIKNPRFLSIALAYTIAYIKENFPNNHLIVGLSATLSRTESIQALLNYIDLAGGLPGNKNQNTEITEWKSKCITSYIAKMYGKIDCQVIRCEMSTLIQEIHDQLIEIITYRVEKEMEGNHSLKKISNLKSQLVNYCSSASLGPTVILSHELKLREEIETLLPNGYELIEKLKLEKKESGDPIAKKSAQYTLDHLKEKDTNKVLIFYHRNPQAKSFRQEIISLLNQEEDSFIYQKEDVMIFCGTQSYPGANYSKEKARERFQTNSSLRKKNYLERILVMSTKVGRGQNFGDATCSIFLGIPLDASDFVQSLGRLLRAGHADPKRILLFLPQEHFLASEVVSHLLLRNIVEMSEFLDGKMWMPLLSITQTLLKYLNNTKEDLENHDQRKKFVNQAYTKILNEWKIKKKEKELKRKHDEPKKPPESLTTNNNNSTTECFITKEETTNRYSLRKKQKIN